MLSSESLCAGRLDSRDGLYIRIIRISEGRRLGDKLDGREAANVSEDYISFGSAKSERVEDGRALSNCILGVKREARVVGRLDNPDSFVLSVKTLNGLALHPPKFDVRRDEHLCDTEFFFSSDGVGSICRSLPFRQQA